jgi:predicted N-acetyltransferase YhbS
MRIREATAADRQAINAVILSAFGRTEGPVIADLVDALNVDPSARPLLSLVAEQDRKIAGHILFSAAKIEGTAPTDQAAILAPLGVDSAFQRRGVGGLLIQDGLRRLNDSGTGLVFVLGHPDYYPRHGFAPAGAQGLEAPYRILPKNAGAWMVQALRPGIIGRVAGVVRCAKALDQEVYWVE